MKPTIKTIGMYLAALLITAFTTTGIAQDTARKKPKNAKAEKITKLLDQKRYVFRANWVQPSRGGNIQLTSDYDLAISGDTVRSFLPFFGRAFTAPMSTDDTGIKFTSTDADYSVKKKDNSRWNIFIKPKDVNGGYRLNLTAFDNGSASLTVISNNREPISFQGTILEKEGR